MISALQSVLCIGLFYYLIVNMIESQNADCIDVLLSAARAPPPVVTGGDSEMILSSDPDRHYHYHYPPWKSVAHGILDTGHALLLLWKKVILPNLIRRKY